jgi:hypothetical protein
MLDNLIAEAVGKSHMTINNVGRYIVMRYKSSTS